MRGWRAVDPAAACGHRIAQAALGPFARNIIKAGYVYSTRDVPAYGVTVKVRTLAAGFDSGRHLMNRLGEALQRLQWSIPRPSDLGIFDGEAIMILGTSRQPGVLSVTAKSAHELMQRGRLLGELF